MLAANARDHVLKPEELPPLAFDPARDLIFDYDVPLPGHANGMVIEALDAQGDVLMHEVYYSIGGGFVRTEAELAAVDDAARDAPSPVPFPFKTAEEMLAMAHASGLSIAQMKRRNEARFRSQEEIDAGLAKIWATMRDCMERGLSTEGELPGGLRVKRRAKAIHESLKADWGQNLAPPHQINDWISAYAMAVNEENAAGGQVVTAPTNGAAGVLPSVIRYWLDHVPTASSAKIPDFLLTAAAVGGADQDQRLDFGGGMWLSGRGRLGGGDGGGGAGGRAGRKP